MRNSSTKQLEGGAKEEYSLRYQGEINAGIGWKKWQGKRQVLDEDMHNKQCNRKGEHKFIYKI